MALPLNRLQSLRSLRYANLDGSFATAFATLTSGAFLVGYMKELGANDTWIGLLAALPSLCGILQIPGGALGQRFESYKNYIAPGGFLWRAFYAPLIVLPMLAISPQLALTLLAVMVACAWVCNYMVGPVYNEWLAELVPPQSRGYFFSRRNALMASIGAVVGIAGGVILDAFERNGYEMRGYSAVYAMGLACAALSMYYYMRMDDTKRAVVVRKSLRESFVALRTPFQDKGFRTVLIFITVFVVGQALPGNLFVGYAIERVKLPFTILQSLALVQAVGMVAAAPLWGFISDKYGNRPSLLIATVMVTLTPIPWLFCVAGQDLHNTLILIPLHLLSGVGWGGANLCIFNLVLATSSKEERSTYIGAALAVQAVIGGIAPLVGGRTLDLLREIMPAQLGYEWIFCITAGLRLSSAIALGFVKEKGSARIKQAFSELRKVTPRGYLAMRNLTRSSDEDSRQQAIQNVANEHLTLATDEIVKALHDPSPKVRRQAAAALAELRSAGAEEALIHQLVEHPDLVEEETVLALAETGSKSAVPHLIALLQSPRPLLRRAAIRALGNIGTTDAITALCDSASDPSDPDSRRMALIALRQLGAREAAMAVGGALLDPSPSVRIVAAEAVSELELGGAAEVLRASLEKFKDEASAEVAYALGAVGTQDDIPLILQEAARSVSIITRRRCLLGVARLLGVEREAYRLLLAEGMVRDTMLQQMVRPLLRSKPRLRAAMERFGAGDDQAALHALSSSTGNSGLRVLEGHEVDELFLVAICVATRH
jgi:MFS family permease